MITKVIRNEDCIIFIEQVKSMDIVTKHKVTAFKKPRGYFNQEPDLSFENILKITKPVIRSNA